MPRLERDFQADFMHVMLPAMFPDCVVTKLNPNHIQGIPDVLLLWRDRWAIFEVKRRKPRTSRDYRPNQEYYLELLDGMSFAACVYPENVEEVLDALQRSFSPRRSSRVPQRV